MSEPAHEIEAEDALRGVVNQLDINGQRMPVIIPGSVIESLHFLGVVLRQAQAAGNLPALVLQAMPWASSLPGDDLNEFASDLVEAATAGERAPERLAAVMREWGKPQRSSGIPGTWPSLPPRMRPSRVVMSSAGGRLSVHSAPGGEPAPGQ